MWIKPFLFSEFNFKWTTFLPCYLSGLAVIITIYVLHCYCYKWKSRVVVCRYIYSYDSSYNLVRFGQIELFCSSAKLYLPNYNSTNYGAFLSYNSLKHHNDLELFMGEHVQFVLYWCKQFMLDSRFWNKG